MNRVRASVQVRRIPQEKSQRDILGQSAGRIGLLVVLVELAQQLLRLARFRRCLDRFGYLVPYLGAQGMGDGKSGIVTARVDCRQHAEHRFAGFQSDLGRIIRRAHCGHGSNQCCR